jgi:isopenicillin-N epimerase
MSPPSNVTFGRTLLAQWALDPAITYLNHGTVGAPPRRVLLAQQALRDEIERQPSRFLLRELAAVQSGMPRSEPPPRLRVAAEQVGRFLGARGEDLVFVDNTTAGANAVLRSLAFAAGDEILISDHAYGGVANAARLRARETGAVVRTVDLPFPEPSPEGVVEAIAAALGPRTRLAIFDHLTSDTSLVLPIAEIAVLCRRRGVPLLVDGAHAPGAIALDITAIGADWYLGNLHKWAWSPRSSAILWVAPERQAALHSPVVSWGLDLGLAWEFDWPGTRDPTPHLAAPAALAMMTALGFEAVLEWNHRLAWEGAHALAARWGTSFLVPEEMVGPMATVPLPPALGSTAEDAARLRDQLLFEDSIEVHVHARLGRLWVRIAAQVYNEMADIDRLGEAIERRLPQF